MYRWFLLLALILVAGDAHAQAIGPEALTLRIEPQYPRPYQTITVTPSSTLIDLSASRIRITANGTATGEVSGAQPVNVQLGGPGTRTAIRAVATASDGRTYTKDMVIRPADVALVLEPVSTVPPFYKGANLVASEGRLRVIAIPDLRTEPNTRLSPANLTYTWKLGEQILQASSGIGKSTLIATAPVRYRDSIVSLTVSTADSSIVAQQSVAIAPVDPIVRVYRNDPLLGPDFTRAITGLFTMEDTEATFRVAPFYFGAPPAISWKVSGAESGGDKDLTVRSTGGAGTSPISVTASHPEFRQTKEAVFSVKFGGNGGFNLFGL